MTDLRAHRNKTQRSRFFKGCKGLFFLVIPVLFLCWYVSAHYYQLMLIQGDSMLPTYRHMHLVALDKQDRAFQTGDVVAFRCDGLKTVLVKRVVATPGQRIVIRDGTLLVNGEASPLYPERAFTFSGLLEEERQLSDGEYVVIGDNITKSKDSRDPDVGIVATETIIGKVAAAFWKLPAIQE